MLCPCSNHHAVSMQVLEEGTQGTPGGTPMSVKDRAKHLNRIESQTDVHNAPSTPTPKVQW